ncbi:hypothetical protein [Nonomuraea glycinis]|uniref:hypothetical protein n=1 Tax=Nonomuraea glycinis TaxID=2047744 RepID=UPI0033BE6081
MTTTAHERTEYEQPTTADPKLPAGGPHWRDCERKHTACAHQLGREQALHEAAQLIADLAHPDDPTARTHALHEAHTAVRRLAGLPPLTYPNEDDTPMPYSDSFAHGLRQVAEHRRMSEAEWAAAVANTAARDAAEEALDLDALSGACADEADSPC